MAVGKPSNMLLLGFITLVRIVSHAVKGRPNIGNSGRIADNAKGVGLNVSRVAVSRRNPVSSHVPVIRRQNKEADFLKSRKVENLRDKGSEGHLSYGQEAIAAGQVYFFCHVRVIVRGFPSHFAAR